MNTIKNLGFINILAAGFSYLKALIFKKREDSLENFYINRFGKKLYSMLNAYEQYKTGKTKEHRLVDALSSRGRLRFKEVNKPAVL